jgi:Kef-type K+ transport system membrane component KefB
LSLLIFALFFIHSGCYFDLALVLDKIVVAAYPGV